MDLLIQGASIWTGRESRPEASEMLIRGGSIVDVGRQGSISPGKHGEGTHVISLDGETIVPGFTDSHIHLSTLARGGMALNLENVSSREELLEAVREKARQVSGDSWIY